MMGINVNGFEDRLKAIEGALSLRPGCYPINPSDFYYDIAEVTRALEDEKLSGIKGAVRRFFDQIPGQYTHDRLYRAYENFLSAHSQTISSFRATKATHYENARYSLGIVLSSTVEAGERVRFQQLLDKYMPMTEQRLPVVQSRGAVETSKAEAEADGPPKKKVTFDEETTIHRFKFLPGETDHKGRNRAARLEEIRAGTAHEVEMARIEADRKAWIEEMRAWREKLEATELEYNI